MRIAGERTVGLAADEHFAQRGPVPGRGQDQFHRLLLQPLIHHGHGTVERNGTRKIRALVTMRTKPTTECQARPTASSSVSVCSNHRRDAACC